MPPGAAAGAGSIEGLTSIESATPALALLSELGLATVTSPDPAEAFFGLWHWLVLVLSVVFAAAAVIHVVLWKRDPRAAFGWLAVILILPLAGSILYWIFGINRIFRKAGALYRLYRKRQVMESVDQIAIIEPGEPLLGLEADLAHLTELATVVARVTREPLYRDNSVHVLETGGVSFAAMIDSIEHATASVVMSTYIFDQDRAGERFRTALRRAKDRGVEVRVLIDAVGDRYSWPPVCRTLVEDGIEAAAFLPTRWPWHMSYANMRNHRKLLVVDGRIAFTGGMNIRQGHVVEESPPGPIHDIHFVIRGPVVGALARIFADDWAFTTGEWLDGEAYFPPPAVCDARAPGNILARVIEDGPADSFGAMRWAYLGGLACARHRVRIATPYFLPDDGLITALAMAARRGVSVEIMIPEQNNLMLVQWACTAMLWQVLQPGCRVFLVPPPFDHSKLMVVDGAWSLIGSGNWDPRSLRLNFELDVECYSRELAATLDGILDRKLASSRELTLEEVDARSLPIRFRDGLARLFTPYL